jgi:hypothetical protein
MNADTARAWAQLLSADPVGGWATIRAEVLATDPADLGRAIATLRWTIEIECHHRPDIQAAITTRLVADLDDTGQGPPPPPPPSESPGSGPVWLIEKRDKLQKTLAHLRACLQTHEERT